MPARHEEGSGTILRGVLLLRGSPGTVACTIREMTERLARLEVADGAILPQSCDLLIHTAQGGTQRKRCKIAWQNGNQVGVTFV